MGGKGGNERRLGCTLLECKLVGTHPFTRCHCSSTVALTFASVDTTECNIAVNAHDFRTPRSLQIYHNHYSPTDASSAYWHIKPSSARTSPPSRHRASPLADPSHAWACPLRPTLTTPLRRSERSWNASDDGGDVTPAVVA